MPTNGVASPLGDVAMKTSTMFLLTLVLAMSAAALAQDKSASAKQENVAGASSRPLRVLGKVSTDGKTILTDVDSEWTVSNATVLKGHEGLLVTVKCYVDTAKNQLQVLTIRRASGELNDAFREVDSLHHVRLDPR